MSADVNGRHPLEVRLKNWGETQQALKMESLMRVYGAHEPIRRGMEMKISGSVGLSLLPAGGWWGWDDRFFDGRSRRSWRC